MTEEVSGHRCCGCHAEAEAATEQKLQLIQPNAAQLKICKAAEEKLKALAQQ